MDSLSCEYTKIFSCDSYLVLKLSDDKLSYTGVYGTKKITISFTSHKSLFKSLSGLTKIRTANYVPITDTLGKPLEPFLQIQINSYVFVPRRNVKGTLEGIVILLNSLVKEGFSKLDEIVGSIAGSIVGMVEQYNKKKGEHEWEKQEKQKLFPEICRLLSCVCVENMRWNRGPWEH